MGGSASKQKQSKKDEEKAFEEQKQIAIAVRFLQSPEVAKIDKFTQMAFLKKKGLTDAMIAKAYEQFKELREQQPKPAKAQQPAQEAKSEESCPKAQKKKP